MEESRLGLIPMFALFQTVHLGEFGIGLKNKGDGSPTLFYTKESAESWLAGLITQIKIEQGIGRRTARNLDPTYEGGLDYCIQKVFIAFDKKVTEERGWDWNTAYDFGKYKIEHPDLPPDHDEAMKMLKNLEKWQEENGEVLENPCSHSCNKHCK